MSIRARALAFIPALLVLACGGTSPPPNDATDTKADAAKDTKVGDSTRGGPEANHGDSADGLGEKPKGDTGPGGPGLGGGKAPEAAVVDTKEPLGGGTLSQEDIRQILEKSGDVFGECYTIGAGGKNKQFTGTVKVKATLGPSGAVNEVQVLSSNTKNAKVDACVKDAFKKIKFPAPKNAGTSVITFPIQFAGLEEVKKP